MIVSNPGKLLTYLNELLSLVLEGLPLPVHDGLEFLEVPQLDLQLLHLSLDQQGHQALDLALLDGRKMFRLHGSGGQG